MSSDGQTNRGDRKPSLLLLGSKPGSVVALKVALRRGWDVRGVVVSRTDPHPWLPGTKLDEAARRDGIPVFHQDTIPDGLRADLVVSYMFRHRVRADTLGRAEIGALNFHAAPLPEFGGYAFYSVAILEQAAEYGCTCHHMDEGFDTGPLCEVRRFPIGPDETAIGLERRAQDAMIGLFVDVLARVERGQDLPKIPQDPARIRYMDRATFDALKEIPADADPERIDRTARAFFYPPYQGAYLRRDGMNVEVVPRAAMAELASLLHAGDEERLEAAAARHERESMPGSNTPP